MNKFIIKLKEPFFSFKKQFFLFIISILIFLCNFNIAFSESETNENKTYLLIEVDVSKNILEYRCFGNLNNCSPTFISNEKYSILNFSYPFINEFVYEIQLPNNIVMNYIRTNCKFFFETEDNFIHGFCYDKEPYLIIQYSTKIKITHQHAFLMIFLPLIAFLFLLIGLKNKFKFKQDLGGTNDLEVRSEEREIYNIIKSLNTRQLLILRYLLHHGSSSLSSLARELKLPKSSVYRNLKSLERKRLIIIIKEPNRTQIIINDNYKNIIKKFIAN